MDYKSIILNGFKTNRDNFEYLIRYFEREQRKAEDDYIFYDEFFDRCNDIIDALNADIDNQLNTERKKNLQILGLCKTDREKDVAQAQLKNINRDRFRTAQNLTDSDIQFIEKALSLAKDKKAMDDNVNMLKKLISKRPQKTKKKTGRKKAKVKPAKEYLIYGETDEVKEKFLNGLHKEFKGCKPVDFNLLIKTMFQKGLIKKESTNKEYKEAFEEAIEPQQPYQAQQNFDFYFKKDLPKKDESNYHKYADILNKISEIQRL